MYKIQKIENFEKSRGRHPKKFFFVIFDIEVVFNKHLSAESDSVYQNCLARQDFKKSGGKPPKTCFFVSAFTFSKSYFIIYYFENR